ncbi:MAG: AAA family ATPase [Patescibacteria group bacterium]
MFFGHGEKIKDFKKLVDKGRLGHAYLFFGDAGIGKFLFAKLLANYLESSEFAISSVPLIDAAFFSPDEKGTIGIPAVREIRNFLRQTPLKSPRRLAVIDNVEALTPEAQSALLKIVEEPPSHALIIFIGHDEQVIFAPLLSRLNKIYFSRFSESEIKKILQEHYDLSAAKAETVAKESFGRLGRAIDIIKGGSENPMTLEAELEGKILELWQKNPFKNSKKLAWMLERESLIKRFDLNKNLQRRAIEEKLHEQSN